MRNLDREGRRAHIAADLDDALDTYRCGLRQKLTERIERDRLVVPRDIEMSVVVDHR